MAAKAGTVLKWLNCYAGALEKRPGQPRSKHNEKRRETVMKEQIQKFGRSLSAMVMPNIGAFIAWGFITALFIEKGWFPNATFAQIVDPMLKYLLPILIGYTGGKNVGGQRGAVVGAIATMGVIVGADIPMFIGAMIAGPLGGLATKLFDRSIEGKIPAGFEMLVNNFSVGIIGGALALIGLVAINPLCVGITSVLSAGVQLLVDNALLPFTAIFVEPAKVLFLNNAINHGIFTPMGVEQSAELGRSIFYMIESNPGPGLGLLLAYCAAGKGSSKSSAAGASIIHFFGGIHEIYFPYVLMNPVMILAPMVGNICALFTLSALGGGLVAAASPGSIIAELLMTPRGSYLANIAGIAVGAAVSFAIGVLLLKRFGKNDDISSAQDKMKNMKAAAKGQAVAETASAPQIAADSIKKIVFACDAGMGSSAMGATLLRKKLRAVGLEAIEVVHAPVSEIPSDAQIIVTHHELRERAATANPNARLITITNFMGAPEYDTLVNELSGKEPAMKA